MEAALGKDLPDQQEVIRCVAQCIRAEVALCEDLSQPLGRVLIVGRNEAAGILAKSLARFLFRDENAVLRIDMGTYAERHQLPRLVGHPGGLVYAYSEGELTEPLWRRPQTVVLLEGIEKAHRDVWQVLVPILEEGRTIEGLGRTVWFTNEVFLLATTVGLAEAFVGAEGSRQRDGFPLESRQAIEREFAPEVLRRVGTIVLLH
jgi:ATP-dependent Clp protease ATP-binding subunit ClpB